MTRDPLTPFRVIDLVLLAVALPVFLVAGLPVLGWVAAAVVWAMWRGIGHVADTRAKQSDDPRFVAGVEAGAMIGRGWLMGLTLLAFGLLSGDKDVGLSAAVLCVLLFTVFFTTKMIARPLDAPHGKEPTPSP
jgi:hypothetical protein